MKRLWFIIVLVCGLSFLLAQNEPPKPEEPKQPAPQTQPPAPQQPVPEDAVAKINDKFISKEEFVAYLFKFCGMQLKDLLQGYISYYIWKKQAEEWKVEVKEEEVNAELEKQVDSIYSNPQIKAQFDDFLKEMEISPEQWKSLRKSEIRIQLMIKGVARYYRLIPENMRKKFEELYPKDRPYYNMQIILITKDGKLKELKEEISKIEEKLKTVKDDSEKAKLEFEKVRLQKKKEILEKMDEKAWAEEVARKLREGEKMEDVAKEEATGWNKTDFDRGFGALESWDENLQKPIEKLKVGEVLGPVECGKQSVDPKTGKVSSTHQGYYVGILKDKREKGEIKFEDIEPYFKREFAIAEVTPMELGQLDKEFRNKHKIETYINKLIGE